MDDDTAQALAIENEQLRDALQPFVDAYRLSTDLCASRTLGDWEAMAKHHTPGGAYQRATLVLSAVAKREAKTP